MSGHEHMQAPPLYRYELGSLSEAEQERQRIRNRVWRRLVDQIALSPIPQPVILGVDLARDVARQGIAVMRVSPDAPPSRVALEDYYEAPTSCYCAVLGRMAPCGWCTREIDAEPEACDICGCDECGCTPERREARGD